MQMRTNNDVLFRLEEVYFSGMVKKSSQFLCVTMTLCCYGSVWRVPYFPFISLGVGKLSPCYGKYIAMSPPSIYTRLKWHSPFINIFLFLDPMGWYAWVGQLNRNIWTIKLNGTNCFNHQVTIHFLSLFFFFPQPWIYSSSVKGSNGSIKFPLAVSLSHKIGVSLPLVCFSFSVHTVLPFPNVCQVWSLCGIHH